MTTYGVAGIFLPPSQAPAWAAGHALQWGQASQLNLTYNKEFIFACNGQSINALEPMNAQLYIAYGTTGGAFGLPSNNEVNDCYLEGMGLVNFNVYLAGANWRLSRNMMRNAQVANINIGDPGGDNAENNTLLSNTLHNDISLEPAGGGYAFYLSHWATQGSSDNQIVNMFGDGCIWSCFSVNSAGLSATTLHMYLGYGGPTYSITSAKFVGTDLIGDNAPPGTATFWLGPNAGLAIINGWQANTTNQTNGQMGVEIMGNNNNSIGCGGPGATAGNWTAPSNPALLVVDNSAGSTNRIAWSCIPVAPPLTIATLPTCAAASAGVTEAISNGIASPAYNATVSTTGTTVNSVFCNGTNWVYR